MWSVQITGGQIIAAQEPQEATVTFIDATPENLYKLLSEVKRRFLACEK